MIFSLREAPSETLGRRWTSSSIQGDPNESKGQTTLSRRAEQEYAPCLAIAPRCWPMPGPPCKGSCCLQPHWQVSRNSYENHYRHVNHDCYNTLVLDKREQGWPT